MPLRLLRAKRPCARILSNCGSYWRLELHRPAMIRRTPTMGLTRRTILAAGAAAAATAALPRAFAQQESKGGTGKFYEKGSVRIYYEEAGAGFPLMRLPGGGLNATTACCTGHSPFN